jgi:hypothetical protein
VAHPDRNGQPRRAQLQGRRDAPTASDGIDGGARWSATQGTLTTAVLAPDGTRLPETRGGHLNPTWVEWLMGFPLGWTDLEDSETPSSPRSPNTSDGS